MKYTSKIYLGIIFAILYIPILTLILFSFNSSESTAVFAGFDLKWYAELFASPDAFEALRNTLVLAILSALLATVIGTAAAEGIYKIRSKFIKASITSITNVPMMNPDIVTGMSMMLFFAAVMAIFKIQDYNEIGFAAMLIAHTTFCLPYVILSVLPRITELGDSLSEAALDLGCTPVQAFLKVKLPNIMSAVLSGAVMAFTLSLDDFVISYFVAPPNFQTLPLLIYSMTKKKVKPDMYALSTIIIVTIFILLLISNFKSENENTDRKKKKVTAVVTSVIAGVAAVAILLSSIMGGGITSGNTETVTLNVYNWGEYMADGSDSEYANVNEMFADYYYAKYGKRVVINYSTYATNEDLFSKLNNSAVSYDIVIPSDYMIEKLIEADLLLEFDVNKDIPNYVYIEDSFKKPYYDPNEKYSVPYTYGMMGIIYNRDMVDEDKLLAESSWGALWDETYAGQILQFNNPRDAFASAMYWKGLDINSTDPAVWDEALDWLIKQKPILQGYVNDEIFDKMTAGSAALAPYFVGDYITMAETEGAADLGFYYPNEGVNYFVDAMCIPKSSKNPEVAKEYINFMLSEEPAIANAEFICYASPNTLVSKNPEYIDYMGEFAYSLLYDKMPEDVNGAYNEKFGTTCYKNFTPEIQSRINTLWENLKLADSTEPWIHIVSISIIATVSVIAMYSIYIKKKRSKAYRLRDKAAAKAKKMAAKA